MLKSKSKKVVEVQDWDDLVMKTYGKPYAFQQQDGCKSRGICTLQVPSEHVDFENDSIPEKINGSKMGVSFNAWISRDPNKNDNGWDKWESDLFWERNFYPTTESIVNDLFKKGLLEEGEYVINIDW